MISRALSTDYINLGFSGSAGAETAIAEYIASLDISIFVYDYDHNAPDTAFLEATHKNMFDIIRKKHPTLPIIMISRPISSDTQDMKNRFDIIKNTYDTAIKDGDKNVYLIDGPTLMALCGEEGTVDRTHPTDFGFYLMANRIAAELEPLLK